MIKEQFEIKNKLGFHARAASMIVENMSRYLSDVMIEKDGREVDAKSIMGIMTLAAGKGDIVTVKADGEDMHDAIEKFRELIERKFDEE